MRKMLLAVVILSGMGSTVFGQIPPNNLGQIVEVATPAGILPQTHMLIGWDSTGFIRQENSLSQYKVFGLQPYVTFLNQNQNANSMNGFRRFGAPSGDDSYEIRYGSDSSHYWLTSGTLAPDQLSFSVYNVGQRPASSRDTSVGIKICLVVFDEDGNGVYTPGEYIRAAGDMAYPLDSTYVDIGMQTTNPFSSNSTYFRFVRTGNPNIPYTQTTFNPATDGLVPPAGTVIRLVAQSADTSAPIVSLADSFYFGLPGAVVRATVIYSFETPLFSLERAPANLTIDAGGAIRWYYDQSQTGTTDTAIVAVSNSFATVYQTMVVRASPQLESCHPNNLGRIVEVANSGGVLTQFHTLVGWDSITGFARLENSLGQYKIFGQAPNTTYLNLSQSVSCFNSYDRFGAPFVHDSYEIRFGSDSSRYWLSGTVLAPNRVPFAVYDVGPRPVGSQDTSGGTRLCLSVQDQDGNGLYTPGEAITVYGDMVLLLDSTYAELSARSTNPFSSSSAYFTLLRTGNTGVPYTQATFDPPSEGVLPPAGTVIRLVAQSADTVPPIVSLVDSFYFAMSGMSVSASAYSITPVTYFLVSPPANMTVNASGVIRWNYNESQAGTGVTVILGASNIHGTSYQTMFARSSTQVHSYQSGNLGRIVEVASSGGVLPQFRTLVGWDSVGFLRQTNSLDQYKVFGRYPSRTWLNSSQGSNPINTYNRFGAPLVHECYEIRFGSDSSRYWIGSILAPNRLPFSVYEVGRRPASSSDTSGGYKLCLQVTDEDGNGLYTPGEYIKALGDLVLPIDSTYTDLSANPTYPFATANAYLNYFRTGRVTVPDTQTTFNVVTDGILPPAGTVIRLVTQTADTCAPIVIAPPHVEFDAPGATLSLRAYSHMPVNWSLYDAPPNMTIDNAGIIHWPYEHWQLGQLYNVTVGAENSQGITLRTIEVIAAGTSYGCDTLTNRVRLTDNTLDFRTGGDGSIASWPEATQAGMKFWWQSGDLVYAGGFYLGTRKSGQSAPDTLTVSEVEFDTEFQPGRILNSGDLGTLITEDPGDSTLGVYVLPDHHNCWPAEAPHGWTGEPLKLSLRDTWTVFNDMSYAHNPPGLFEEAPMLGLEIQRQTFMFSAYPWNNVVLVRMRIINRSNRTYDSSFAALWQDADVGVNPGSDLSAVDSALSMVYTYNGSTDAEHVALGALLLQGPLDYAGTTDTAVTIDIDAYGFSKRIRTSRTMRMASAAIAYRGGQGDPGGEEEDQTRYYYLNGWTHLGQPKPLGPFDMFLGPYPGDQRTILSSGPFTFAAGDTQDIWYAYVGALANSDSDAVDTLLNYAELMHQTFQGNMNDIVVGVSDRQVQSVPDFRLYSNYPNPFNPTTTIKYVLPNDSRVSLKVYNILGQEVRTLVNKQQGVGEHSVVWDGKNKLGRAVSSGVYLYRLEVDGKVKVKKMMVLK